MLQKRCQKNRCPKTIGHWATLSKPQVRECFLIEIVHCRLFASHFPIKTLFFCERFYICNTSSLCARFFSYRLKLSRVTDDGFRSVCLCGVSRVMRKSLRWRQHISLDHHTNKHTHKYQQNNTPTGYEHDSGSHLGVSFLSISSGTCLR